MSEPDADTYPEDSSRRRFVKGVVGSAAVAGGGTATAAAVNTSTSTPGGGGGPTEFYGIQNTDGPAPRGMPMIPVRIDGDGYLKGLFPDWETTTRDGREVQVAETELGGITYSVEWFQYCGVQTYPGLQPEQADEQDQYFRYDENPTYQWQAEQVTGGNRINVDDFENYETWGNGIGQSGIGKPAIGTWRSQGIQGPETIPIQVLRLPPDVFGEMRETTDHPEWLDAASASNFIAWMDKCTHFCCVPGFKTTPQSAKFEAANEVYCPCHQSVYDPNTVERGNFVAYPRPSD